MGYSFRPLAFVGPSGSGKTTLIEKLIARLSSQGVRVGAIKRSHHRVDIDREGKDSWRFRRAGANPTAVAGEGFIAHMEKTDKKIELDQLLKKFEGKADIVLIEGFKNENVPRFAFAGSGGGEGAPADVADENVMGFVIEGETGPGRFGGKPVFRRDEIAEISEYIIQRVIGDE